MNDFGGVEIRYLAGPFAPFRRGAGSGQSLGDRVFGTNFGDLRAERLFSHLPIGCCGKDCLQRSACQTVGAGEFGTGGDEEGTAVSNVADDVLQIGQGQDGLLCVAVKNDQIEVVDLGFEEFTGRKGDQGEFADGRAILFLGRA